MTQFKKLDQIRKHLCPPPKQVSTSDGERRVQKNLTILERDAARLKALAKRANVSQARLLTEALDAYENIQDK